MAESLELPARRRREDHSLFGRINTALGQYRLIWYLALALGVALVFGFKTPAQQFTASLLRDSLMTLRHDSLVRVIREKDLIWQGMGRYTCLKDPENARMAGLPCSYLGAVP